MKRISTLLIVLASAIMLTACTKCSQEQPAEAPPVVEPQEETAPADGTMPPADMPADTTGSEPAAQ